MIIVPKETPFIDGEQVVIEGECYTPSEMYNNGITTVEEPRKAVYGNEHRDYLEDYEKNDMSLNDAFEMAQDAKKNIKKVYKAGIQKRRERETQLNTDE